MAAKLLKLAGLLFGSREARTADASHHATFENSPLANPVQDGARAYGMGVLYQTPKQLGAPAAHMKLKDGIPMSQEQRILKDFLGVSCYAHTSFLFGIHGLIQTGWRGVCSKNIPWSSTGIPPNLALPFP